jgi:hypothetical protein
MLPLLLSDVELAHPKILADGNLVNWTLHLIAGRARSAGIPSIVGVNDLIGAPAEGTGRTLADDELRLAEFDVVGLLRSAAGKKHHDPSQNKNHRARGRHRVLPRIAALFKTTEKGRKFCFFAMLPDIAVDKSLYRK